MLRRHQRSAVDAVVSALGAGGRGQVVMPCGTGKTLVGIGAAARLDVKLALVVVPTLALIKQTASAWCSAYQGRLRVLFACSDASVPLAEDESALRTSDVADSLGAPVSTDPHSLAGILANWSSRASVRAVAFATYASLGRALMAARLAGTTFDLVIADEAHHCAGPWRSPWTVLARHGDTDDVPAHRRLFLTATPKCRGETDAMAQEVAGMDDVEAFGPVLYELPLAQAIATGLLADYQIAVVGSSQPQWRQLTRATSPGSEFGRLPEVVARSGHRVQATLDAALLAATFALSRTMAHYSLRRILTFHARVRDAQVCAAAVPALLSRLPLPNAPRTISAAAAYADMPRRGRAQVLARFEQACDSHAVIATNVRCLAEGIDIPALDAVLFANPRRGVVDIVQAVGRVMRPYPRKVTGTVIRACPESCGTWVTIHGEL